MCRLLYLMLRMLSQTHGSSGHLHKTPPISIPSLGRAHKAHFSQRDYRPMKAAVTLQERALTMLLQAVLITRNGSPKMWQKKGDLRSVWWMGNEIRGNNERDTNQRGERKRDFKRIILKLILVCSGIKHMVLCMVNILSASELYHPVHTFKNGDL